MLKVCRFTLLHCDHCCCYVASFAQYKFVLYYVIVCSCYWSWMVDAFLSMLDVLGVFYVLIVSLQCFDAVGWVAGRASGL